MGDWSGSDGTVGHLNDGHDSPDRVNADALPRSRDGLVSNMGTA